MTLWPKELDDPLIFFGKSFPLLLMLGKFKPLVRQILRHPGAFTARSTGFFQGVGVWGRGRLYIESGGMGEQWGW